jgi:hypothetical protein
MNDMILLLALTLQVVVDHLTDWSCSICQSNEFSLRYNERLKLDTRKPAMADWHTSLGKIRD